MTIKEFIEKAREGGWCLKLEIRYADPTPQHPDREYPIDSIFLDPEAWKAVGKVEGWDGCSADHGEFWNKYPHWQYAMHQMIDALCEGKSLEEYIKGL